MKYILIKIFFIILLFFLKNSLADDFDVTYTVSTSGIKIGQFNWSLKIVDKDYITKISLQNSGFFSSVYKFKGLYKTEGKIEDKMFMAENYKQHWETRKKTKIVEMSFNKHLTDLTQTPIEQEFSRVEFRELFKYYDPITSFLNILNGNNNVKTVDGRRVYTMTKSLDKKSNVITIKINDYKNIWADHKRNDLKKIEFFLEDGFLPKQINIYFKKNIFKLKKV